MKKLLLVLFVVGGLCSCGNLGYLVSYSVDTVSNTPTDINVTYLSSGSSITETVTTPFYFKTFCNNGDLIGVSAFSGSEEIEIRVFFKKKDSWQTYDIKSGVGEITVKGVIHSL